MTITSPRRPVGTIDNDPAFCDCEPNSCMRMKVDCRATKRSGERRSLKSGTEHTRAMITIGRYAEERTAPRRLAEAEAATLDAAKSFLEEIGNGS